MSEAANETGDAVGTEDEPRSMATNDKIGPIEVVVPPDPVSVDVPISAPFVGPVAVPFSPEQQVLEGAEIVSKGLLRIFAIAILLTLLTPLLLLAISGGNLELATRWMDAYAKLLKEVSGFSVTVFGPLLAFVLGFYFKDRARK
jgi:hypothetical protein